MVRRGRHPSFGPSDQDELLRLMGATRHKAIMCGSSAGYSSPLHQKTDAVRAAIDGLAEELTGDPQFYWLKAAVSRSGG